MNVNHKLQKICKNLQDVAHEIAAKRRTPKPRDRKGDYVAIYHTRRSAGLKSIGQFITNPVYLTTYDAWSATFKSDDLFDGDEFEGYWNSDDPRWSLQL